MNFYESAKKLAKLFEEEKELTKEEILTICNNAYDSSLNIDPEDVEEYNVDKIKIGNHEVQRINYQDIIVCTLETFKAIIYYYVAMFKSSMPDALSDYINENELENDTLTDKYLVYDLSKYDDDQYGNIVKFEEVNFNGTPYIVAEID